MLQNKKAGRVKVLEQSGQWLEIRSGWLGIRSNHILHDVTYKCFLFFVNSISIRRIFSSIAE
jgi:hypothetical protein